MGDDDGWRERFAADWDWWLRCMRERHSVRVIAGARSPLSRAIAAAKTRDQAKLDFRPTADAALVLFPTLPPSKNRTKQPIPWRDENGKFSARLCNTAIYETWIRNTRRHIMLVQRPPQVTGDVIVLVECQTNRRMDVPNFTDAACDMLQKAGVILNDKAIVDFQIRWCDGIEGARVSVRRA